MKSYAQFFEVTLKFKKKAPKIFDIIGTNAFIDGQAGGWKLFVGDLYDPTWIETFRKKQDAIDWILNDEKRAKSNGIVFK